MSISVPEFWKLLAESRLLTYEQCEQLKAEFDPGNAGHDQRDATVLAEWLVSRRVLTSYQANTLRAGCSGPFHFGDYTVYNRIDEGRLAGVFRAVHKPTNHPVLLKFATGPIAEDLRQWAELTRCVEAQAAVLHANLNRVFEAVDNGSYKFTVVEDLQGKSLDERLSGGRRLPPCDAARAARMAALALGELHAAGLVHGDVRPANLWFEANGNTKLLRDPFHRPLPLQPQQRDNCDVLAERADYVAPELAQRGKWPDALTDMYALGCTLYRLLSGRPPFAGGELSVKLERHATERIEPLEKLGVPEQLAKLVTYLMAKNPTLRYQQASVVAEQLTRFVDPSRLSTKPPPSSPTLPNYEAWLRKKRDGSTMKTSAGSPSREPSPTPETPGPALPHVHKGTVPNTTGLGSLGGNKPGTPSPSSALTERYRNIKRQKQIVFAGVGLCLVALLGGFVLYLTLGGLRGGDDLKNPQDDATEKIAQQDLKQPSGDGKDGATEQLAQQYQQQFGGHGDDAATDQLAQKDQLHAEGMKYFFSTANWPSCRAVRRISYRCDRFNWGNTTVEEDVLIKSIAPDRLVVTTVDRELTFHVANESFQSAKMKAVERHERVLPTLHELKIDYYPEEHNDLCVRAVLRTWAVNHNCAIVDQRFGPSRALLGAVADYRPSDVIWIGIPPNFPNGPKLFIGTSQQNANELQFNEIKELMFEQEPAGLSVKARWKFGGESDGPLLEVWKYKQNQRDNVEVIGKARITGLDVNSLSIQRFALGSISSIKFVPVDEVVPAFTPEESRILETLPLLDAAQRKRQLIQPPHVSKSK